jgi:hypothetical protein
VSSKEEVDKVTKQIVDHIKSMQEESGMINEAADEYDP